MIIPATCSTRNWLYLSFLCCRGIRDIPSVPTVDLHGLPSFALLRHSANFMREREGGPGFSGIKLQHTGEIECNVHHVLICRVFAGTERIWQYGPLEGTLYWTSAFVYRYTKAVNVQRKTELLFH